MCRPKIENLPSPPPIPIYANSILLLLILQNMAAENEKLRDEVSQMKAANEKSGMATIASSSEVSTCTCTSKCDITYKSTKI